MYSTHKRACNIEGHLRFLIVQMVRGKRLELASVNYFAGNALVFTLDRACGYSQLQEPTQFIRVVQVGFSPPLCPYWFPARSPHRRVRFQEGTIFDPYFGPWRDLRSNSSSFNCSNKSKWIDIGPCFSGWVGSRPKCLVMVWYRRDVSTLLRRSEK